MAVGEFNGKKFNTMVFEKYLDRVPNLARNELIKNGVYDVKNKYKSLMTNQDGGDYIITPIKGLLDGEVQNYDGVVSMVPTSTKTFTQGKPVFGRMKAWQEKDFAMELTGVDWVKDIAGEVAQYYEGVDQADLLAILKGIFAMNTTGATNAGNKEFVEKHTYDITSETNAEVSASTLNNAVQKALGANKGIITLAFMHSVVATNLENMQLLSYMLYNDANGIQRQLNIGTWNGRVVIVDDDLPTTEVPETSEGAGDGYTAYTTYLLGRGAFEQEQIPVRVASEVSRDPATNGGIDVLYTRRRQLVAPKWISYTKASQASNSATTAELATGANWELVNDGASSGRVFVNHKAIPIVRIISKG